MVNVSGSIAGPSIVGCQARSIQRPCAFGAKEQHDAHHLLYIYARRIRGHRLHGDNQPFLAEIFPPSHVAANVGRHAGRNYSIAPNAFVVIKRCSVLG